MFKKYGRIIILVIILLVLTELSFRVNQKIDDDLENRNNDKYTQLIDDSEETKEALEKGLNGNQPIWNIELDLLRNQFPTEDETIYQYVSMGDWQSNIDALKEKISEQYVSDEDILSSVLEIIPDEFESDIFEDYFQAIKAKNPDIFYIEK